MHRCSRTVHLLNSMCGTHLWGDLYGAHCISNMAWRGGNYSALGTCRKQGLHGSFLSKEFCGGCVSDTKMQHLQQEEENRSCVFQRVLI